MAEEQVILLSTIKVDNYVKSFFKTFGCVGYDAACAKKVEKAMADFFNKKPGQKFKLEKHGLQLSDSESGRIFAASSPQATQTPARPADASSLDNGPLLTQEKSHIKFV